MQRQDSSVCISGKSPADVHADARLDAALRASGVRLVPHPHQRDAVRWWVAREGTTETARAVQSGGILADEMGLGKSMSAVMSILLCRSALAGPAPRPRAPAPLPGTWAGTSAPVAAAGRASAGGRVVLAPTLIVCPKSLLIQWQREILKHTTLGPADMHAFYGRAGRRITRRQITDKVFVLTTYEIVLGSFDSFTSLPRTAATTATLLQQQQSRGARTSMAKSGADAADGVLHAVEWDRIVLDEAHTIRNWQTSKTHRAVSALRAPRRWCLTGTAFNNSASDVIALCRFIGIAPYVDTQWWTTATEQQTAEWRRTFLLRRTKDMLAASVPSSIPMTSTTSTTTTTATTTPEAVHVATPVRDESPDATGGTQHLPVVPSSASSMTLPPKVEKVRRVALNEREAAFYDGLAVGAVADFGAFTQSNGADKSRMFGQILDWLTRLRQACCDPLVLKGRAATIIYSPTSRAESARHEACCVRCHATAADPPARLVCGHISCVPCIKATGNDCVLCFGAHDERLSGPPSTSATSGLTGSALVPRTIPTEPACGPSSRTASMIRFMNKIFARDRQCKMVVFSQWSTYLDLIESAVVTHVGVDYVRIDGAVRQIERRNALVNRFSTDPAARCLLMTIGVGSVGLNLVCANYVLLMDAHYNPFAEAQAIDRVHRIGQTRPVRVVRFLSDASVDAAVAQIQAVKRAGAAAFLGGPTPVRRGDNGGNTGKQGSAMARGIDERQLRSILGEMIAARRDAGETVIDPFVITKSSCGGASRGMQCNATDSDDDDNTGDEYAQGSDDNDSIEEIDSDTKTDHETSDDDDRGTRGSVNENKNRALCHGGGGVNGHDSARTRRNINKRRRGARSPHRRDRQHVDYGPDSDADGYSLDDEGGDDGDHPHNNSVRDIHKENGPANTNDIKNTVIDNDAVGNVTTDDGRSAMTERSPSRAQQRGANRGYDIVLDFAGDSDDEMRTSLAPRRPTLRRLKRTADMTQNRGGDRQTKRRRLDAPTRGHTKL